MPAERYSWFIQINPDGSIPPKGISTAQPKSFEEPGVNTTMAQRARDHMAFLAAQDEGDEGRTHEIGHDLGFR
jgi:hypothetical protein